MNFEPKHLTCRDIAHAWEYDGDVVVERDSGGIKVFHRNVICLRCGTTRTDVFHVTERHVVSDKRKYKYAKGYQVKGGLNKQEARYLLLFPRVSKGDK